MRTSALAVLLSLAAPLAARAQEPAYLVRDINTVTSSSPSSSSPYGFFRFGSRIVFAAAGSDGIELWSTDGTPAGTAEIANIYGSSGSSSPSRFAIVNGKLLFNALDATHGEELWVSDGTAANTRLLADIQPGSAGSRPGDRIVYGGKLIFAATENLDGTELWTTDGTPAGTMLLKDLRPGSAGSEPSSFVLFNGSVYFIADGALWKTDGTAGGTVKVKSANIFGSLTVAGSRLYFAASSTPDFVFGPWVSDGTDAGTQPLAPSSPGSFATSFMPFGDGVLFQNLGKLWISDGTAAGTRVVRDDVLLSTTPGFAVAGNIAYFAASSATLSEAELWRTDGTAAGTFLVRDIAPGPANGGVRGLVAAGDKVYFVATSSAAGRLTLWVSDGTAAGTRQVKAAGLAVGFPPSGPTLANIDGTIWFSGANALNGYELWKSDGTDAGTTMVANISADLPPGSFPRNFTAAGGLLFFDAWNGLGTFTDPNQLPRSLWRTDGTAAGTIELTDLPFAAATAAGSRIYFMKNNKLWTSDGTPEGTGPDTELARRFPAGFNLQGVVGDRIFAYAYPNTWMTTAAAGAPAYNLGDFAGYGFVDVAGLTLFFASNATGNNSALWRTDGTPGGTFRIAADVANLQRSAAVSNGILYFSYDKKLWKSDGTPDGTGVVKSGLPQDGNRFVAAGKNVFFTVNTQLWVTDGTEAGTHALPAFPNAGPAAAGDRAVFIVNNATGYALWVSDGTAEGTRQLRPPQFFDILGLATVGGLVYFTMGDDRGVEPWVTDGTPEGTLRAADVEPGSAGSFPHDFALAGDRIYFSATTSAAGTELWAISIAQRLTIGDARVSEGDSADGVARFTVTLSAAAKQSVSVDYASADGSAHAGSDYDAAAGTLTFAPGETAKSIDVRVHGDTATNGNRIFFVTLKNAAGAAIDKASGSGVIEDDDQTADLGLALDIFGAVPGIVVANVANNGPSVATNAAVTTTVTPRASSFDCPACSASMLLLPGATVTALRDGATVPQRYWTATAASRQRDPQPANNSVAWTSGNSMAMDALYLTTGGQANVSFSPFLPGTYTLYSSDPAVVSVPSSSLTVTAANKTATFVARGAGAGTATIRAVDAIGNSGSLAIIVVAPGTKPRWPGGVELSNLGTFPPFDVPVTVTVNTRASAPYSGETATGLVIVTEKGRELGRVTLTRDKHDWTLPVYVADVGATTIDVSYSGDANFLPAAQTWPVQALTGNATINATATERSATTATVRVIVAGSPAAAPSGTVTMSELAKIPVQQATLVQGQAEFRLTNLAPGTHTLVFNYSGDARYRASSQSLRLPMPRTRAAGH